MTDEDYRDELQEIMEQVWAAIPWRNVAGICLLLLVVVTIRAGWSYTVSHDPQNQCAALHLFQADADRQLHTTDVAASSRLNEVESAEVLTYLHEAGFLQKQGRRGVYPFYRLTASTGQVSNHCGGVRFRSVLRDPSYWRVERPEPAYR